MKLLSYSDLKSLKGIPFSRVTLWRKVRVKKFPKQDNHFEGRFSTWWEDVVDAYLEALAEGHSEQEATAIAENLRPVRRRRSASGLHKQVANTV